MDGDAQSMECPFCGYRPQKEEHADYQMSLVSALCAFALTTQSSGSVLLS